jgi:hypothetical protein
MGASQICLDKRTTRHFGAAIEELKTKNEELKIENLKIAN